MIKKFALIGAAGYIAERHLKAIKETNNELVAAFDPFDSVGILDSYFPDTAFFVEFERFDRHIDKLQRSGNRLDYMAVCSPNYLHDSHIRFGLRCNTNVIVEKPLVLNPWNAESLLLLEKEYGKKVYNILQLRLHPSILSLKKKIEEAEKTKIFNFDLTYITSRGRWYYTSWKGDSSKSGGIVTNIGIHFFDVLIWLFGSVKKSTVHVSKHDRAAGFLELERANVRWFLSIDKSTLPTEISEQGGWVYRSMVLDGEEVEFTEGFTDLHTESYNHILANTGFGIADALPGIELVHQIRNEEPVGLMGSYHPFAAKPHTIHPFLA